MKQGLQTQVQPQLRIALLINPYAGIGGALALKGSDGIAEQALAQGATSQARQRTQAALTALLPYRQQLKIVTAHGEMGGALALDMGFHTQVLTQAPTQKQSLSQKNSQGQPRSTAQDSQNFIQALLKALLANELDIDLLLFAGGDGTARDICAVFDQVERDLAATQLSSLKRLTSLPCLGIPAGVKIHSGVYALTPEAAGRILQRLMTGRLVDLTQGEVRDIDEQAFRQGQVKAKYYGELCVPAEPQYMQAVKMGGQQDDCLLLDDLAAGIAEMIDADTEHYFIIGSGKTLDAVMQQLGLDNTLLGVDLVYQGQLIAQDLSAAQLLTLTANKPCKLLITVIGGQGHVFGRGNQQLSAAFIRQLAREQMIIVATKAKLLALEGRPLIADTGDLQLNQALAGFYPIITGYQQSVFYRLANPEFEPFDPIEKDSQC